jgi:hypothetical protein
VSSEYPFSNDDYFGANHSHSSDLDHRDNPHSTAPGYGSTTTSTTTAGPHSSNVMNKVDPRVDSDLDHRANPNSNVPGYGSGTSGYGGTSGYSSGTTGHGTTAHGTTAHGTTTTSGPHTSNIANKLDPRVEYVLTVDNDRFKC